MIPDVAKLGEQLFQNMESIRTMWSDIFGLKFQATWDHPEEAIEVAVKKSRDIIERNKYIDEGTSHSTLFMRDPLTDRLYLEYSTNNEFSNTLPSDRLFTDRNSNFDNERRKAYYRLHDSLSDDEEKRSPYARKNRGLTGWVALTGIPLTLNNSHSLESLEVENLKAAHCCAKYGPPEWSNRIRDFSQPSRDWSTRFMAVPIISKIEDSKTVGVLRYSCPINGKELSTFDLSFLIFAADLISALKNIEQVKILCNRDSGLEKAILSFQQSGDFSEFLHFICESLRSKISSLYIYLSQNKTLRMVDAYGISELTGDIRNKLKDYSEQQGGLTWEMRKNNDLEPKVCDSVVLSPGWEGKNTDIFYGKALKELGIKIESKDKQQLLTTYPIKLMGCNFKKGSHSIGVLKVEFPINYDDSEHYKQSDKIFFKKCAEVIRNELLHYHNFICGNWFSKDDKGDRVDEFIRYIIQIFRYKLIDIEEDEFNEFWDNVQLYASRHSSEIQKVVGNERHQRIESFQEVLKDIRRIDKTNNKWLWLKEAFIKELIKVGGDIIVKSIC